MKRVLASITNTILSGIGVFIGIFIILLTIIGIQGMSGREPFIELLLNFSISFAIGFGISAAAIKSLARKDKRWPAACSFAGGGVAGAAVLAFVMKAMECFEQQLREFTNGGPLTVFQDIGILAAIVIATIVGATLLRAWNSKRKKI